MILQCGGGLDDVDDASSSSLQSQEKIPLSNRSISLPENLVHGQKRIVQ